MLGRLPCVVSMFSLPESQSLPGSFVASVQGVSQDSCATSVGRLSLSLKPLGWRVPNFWIQKSSLFKRRFRICSFVKFFLVISSITTIRKSRLKLSPGWLKCRSMLIASGLATSFLCLLTRRLVPCDSTFPTYCSSLHLRHNPR